MQRHTNAKETEQYLQTLLEDVVTETITLPVEEPEPEHIEITAQFDLQYDKVIEIRNYLGAAIKAGKKVNVYVFNQ